MNDVDFLQRLCIGLMLLITILFGVAIEKTFYVDNMLEESLERGCHFYDSKTGRLIIKETDHE